VKKKDKWEANDVNKQAIYIAPKSTNESRAHYAPEPAWGCKLQSLNYYCMVWQLLLLVLLTTTTTTTTTTDL